MVADYGMFVNEYHMHRVGWGHASLPFSQVHLGLVLDSELWQEWKYGVLKACIYA